MVALTLNKDLVQYGWFCHGRSHININANVSDDCVTHPICTVPLIGPSEASLARVFRSLAE